RCANSKAVARRGIFVFALGLACVACEAQSTTGELTPPGPSGPTSEGTAPMARARELLTQAASAASEADGNAKRAMAAELLESEWRRAGDPAVGARAVRVWAGVGPGKGHCAAQL